MSQHDNSTKSNLRLFAPRPNSETSLADITKSFMQAGEQAEKAHQQEFSRLFNKPALSLWRNDNEPNSLSEASATPLKVVK